MTDNDARFPECEKCRAMAKNRCPMRLHNQYAIKRMIQRAAEATPAAGNLPTCPYVNAQIETFIKLAREVDA